MPKKRNTFWFRNKREKQILTARLIEISLKVDDHIYKHKSISECEAEQYMREVSSYKVQCSRDERSLQVIEKLTRCMKAIIFDHQELRANMCGENNVNYILDGDDRAGSMSPVYSISDEDRTQLTQIAEERPRTATEVNKDIEIIDLSNIDDDNYVIHEDTDTTTADNAGIRINVEVDIHRGISNLSLRDVEQLEITGTDANCSQSIINSFEGIEEIQQNKIRITSQETTASKFVSNVTDNGKTTTLMQTDKIIIANDTSINKLPFKIPNKIKPIIEPYKAVKSKIKNVLSKENIPTDSENNLTTMSCQTYYSGANNITESYKQTWYDTNRTCTIDHSSHLLKDANQLTLPAHIHKAVNQRNHITAKDVAKITEDIPTNTFYEVQNGSHTFNATETSNAQLYNDTAIVQDIPSIKKKRAPRKKKTLEENEIKSKNKRVSRAPKSRDTNSEKNKCVPIYNTNVINDLSWIENIRYVREIRVDENDATLNLEDSFWDNYHLPDNWNDNEFMYC